MNWKGIIKFLAFVVGTGLICFLGLGYFSSYIGWYGYDKWKHRVGTGNIDDSKARQVFVKELNYKVENYDGELYGFIPYIEKGFKYGYHTSEETIPLTYSDYPYQLRFSYEQSSNFGVLISTEELQKFDSSNAVHGFLKYPKLNDTITLQIGGECCISKDSPRIKVLVINNC